MASPKVLKEVLQHPQSIEMHEGVLHIRDVEGPKRTGSVGARLEAMEQQVFKCQGMVERGLNTNHMMITEFTNKHKIDAKDIREHFFKLYDKIDHQQAQIYDLQNQNYESVPSKGSVGKSSPRNTIFCMESSFELINMSGSNDSENAYREQSMEVDSSTSHEKTDSDPSSPTSHDIPKAATRSRKRMREKHRKRQPEHLQLHS
ncbi:40S ribosomal protein S5-1 [Hordeum vulgare]|nr:40S ribosomal protein S5-1 [Hordeum vulgare]